MKYITTEMFERKGACQDDLELFKTVFKSGKAAINKNNMARAVKSGIDVNFCCVLLSGEPYKQYLVVLDEAWKQYGAARNEAQKRYVAERNEALLSALIDEDEAA